jgi:cytoskeletal protein RodZ
VVTYLTVASEQPGELGTRAQTALAELEQLDPEGVKQARSLMAFGALGRARASSSADKSTDSAKSQSAVDSSSAADPATGLAASAAEIKEADEANPADFPDPESFAQSAAADEPVVGENEANVETKAEDSSTPQQAVAKPVVDTEKSPTSSAAAPPVGEAELNSYLAVGIPLGAAALLMGIYWMILRTGAV